MSIHGAGLEHRLYVLFALLTHAGIGYVLGSVMREPAPLAAVAGAILPDVDLLFDPGWSFPLVHRGLTHTPLFGASVVAAVWLGGYGLWIARPSRGSSRRTPLAVAIGYGSHLVVDSLTASGVPWLYPASSVGYGVDVGVHAVEYSLALWAVLAAVWVCHRRRTADGSV